MTDDIKLTAYLAGPIADCNDAECKDWRNQFKETLPEIKWLDPMRRDYRAYRSAQENFKEIVEFDKQDIDESDVVVVYHDRPSVGTSMEILYAWERNAYVLTIHATGKPLSPWIIYHSTKVVKTIEEAIEELKPLIVELEGLEEADVEDIL